MWDCFNPVLGRQGGARFLAIQVLGPRHLLACEKGKELGSVLVEADSDDFEASCVVFFVGLEHVRQLRHAGPALRGPEVDQHHFPLHRGQGKRFSLQARH